MDVSIMVRRKKMTIFLDAKDTTLISEIKKMLEGILKIPSVDQQLYSKDNTCMDDDHILKDYGIVPITEKGQIPETIGLAVRSTVDSFEPLEITPYTAPPDLPTDQIDSPENDKDPITPA